MIPVLSKEQIHKADQFTITNEPISSIALMHRAGSQCLSFITQKFDHSSHFDVVCGTGNNGGDGLVVALGLLKSKYSVNVCIIGDKQKCTNEFAYYLKQLTEFYPESYKWIDAVTDFPIIDHTSIVVDAIFGIGLNKQPTGLIGDFIKYINSKSYCTIAIDLPSGMLCDASSLNFIDSVIKAKYTLTFQVYKLALLLPENSANVGEIVLLDINLNKEFIQSCNTELNFFESADAQFIFNPRQSASNKFDFGHALIIAGSLGKMGAAQIAASACLRTGVGLLSVQIPKCGNEIMQTSIPEAMVLLDEGDNFIQTTYKVSKHNVIAIGPGIGRVEETAGVLKSLIQNTNVPLVIDADALNILSDNKTWLSFFATDTVLTPHRGEFERLFGKFENDFEQLSEARNAAVKHNVIIVLKGKYTAVINNNGKVCFNSSGNVGLAKGGSGDALTGIITALIAQGYSVYNASLLGVYLHGLAADITLSSQTPESMVISDVIRNLGKAFTRLIR